MSIALVGLGANLHDRAATLREATSRLAAGPAIRVLAASSLVETAAVGGPSDQPAFLNAALLVETTLSPTTIAGELVACEIALGRRRDLRWGPRTIDLDLLLFDDRVIESPELSVPHPRMAFRRFVLAPACEIAATMLHPISGWPLSRLLAHLDSGPDYVAVAGGDTNERMAIVRKTSERTVARPISLPPSKSPTGSPAGFSLGSLEWLDEASQLLSHAAWANSGGATVSDFWFDEPMLAATEASTADAHMSADEWKARRLNVVQPKLVAWLDNEPRATPRDDEPGSGEEMSRWLTRQPPRRRVFYTHVLSHDVGPTLRLEPGSPEQAADEIIAALAAMRPLIERIK